MFWINTQGAYSKFYLRRGGCLLERRQLFEGGHLSISCTDSLEGEAWKVITKEAIETGLPCISAT